MKQRRCFNHTNGLYPPAFLWHAKHNVSIKVRHSISQISGLKEFYAWQTPPGPSQVTIQFTMDFLYSNLCPASRIWMDMGPNAMDNNMREHLCLSFTRLVNIRGLFSFCKCPFRNPNQTAIDSGCTFKVAFTLARDHCTMSRSSSPSQKIGTTHLRTKLFHLPLQVVLQGYQKAAISSD